MVEGNESLPSGEAVNDTLKGLLDSAYEKWEAGDCHDPGCGCVTEYMRRELIPFIEQAIRAEVQTAEANALQKAAEHVPMVAIKELEGGNSGPFVWVYCSCGFNRDAKTLDPADWGKHILSLIPPASQTLLDARDAAQRRQISVEGMKREPCGHFVCNMIGDEYGHFTCDACEVNRKALDAHDAEVRRPLRALLEEMFMAADAEWENQHMGHDWADFCRRVRLELRAASQPTPGAGKQ
jgi:hypothetical protein